VGWLVIRAIARAVSGLTAFIRSICATMRSMRAVVARGPKLSFKAAT
jgi:hypothetical protein